MEDNKDNDDNEYEIIKQPFIIRNILKNEWSCNEWTLMDWIENFNQIKFKFRIHNKNNNDKKNYWENNTVDIIEATLKEFINFIENKHNDNDNPFNLYSNNLNNYCFYSSYNYLDQLIDDNDDDKIKNLFDWKKLKLFCQQNNQINYEKLNSTLWLGTMDSCTPCHQDTYGYNFVVQLYGRKKWILFPPENKEYLHPTRIPYEESSIFSEINFKQINKNKYFESIKNTEPYGCYLEKGDLLFIPYHWWHYVENKSTISISINVWIDSNVFNIDDEINNKDHIKECITQLLFNLLYKNVNDEDKEYFLNDLKSFSTTTTEELINILKFLIKNNNDDDELLLYKKPKNLKINYLDRMDIEQFEFNDNDDHDHDHDHDHEISTKDLFNSILDVDVIDLIVKKLFLKYEMKRKNSNLNVKN